VKDIPDQYAIYRKDLFGNITKEKAHFVPEIAGWLNPNGEKDDKYSNDFRPVGYKPDIVGFRKVESFAYNENFKKIANKWCLFAGEDANIESKYGQREIYSEALITGEDIINSLYGDISKAPTAALQYKDAQVQYIWSKNVRESHKISVSAKEIADAFKADMKDKFGKLFGGKKKK
jgi:hypothetical protein